MFCLCRGMDCQQSIEETSHCSAVCLSFNESWNRPDHDVAIVKGNCTHQGAAFEEHDGMAPFIDAEALPARSAVLNPSDLELRRLRTWLHEEAQAPSIHKKVSLFATLQDSDLRLRPDQPLATPADMPAELVELLIGVMNQTPQLFANEAPAGFALVLADASSRFQKWDAEELTDGERAVILAEGGRYGAVDRAGLAGLLGKAREGPLRQAFFERWVDSWLEPYLESRPFGPNPDSQEAPGVFRGFTKNPAQAMRTPAQAHSRKCGRLLVDAMKDVFGRVMRLVNVEQEALIRILENFAAVLCDRAEVQDRFAHASLRDRPPGVESLSQAVFLLAYHGLILHSAIHKLAARGGPRVQTRTEFASQGSHATGFREDFCMKMFDMIEKRGLG